jgi:hypothetical protein
MLRGPDHMAMRGGGRSGSGTLQDKAGEGEVSFGPFTVRSAFGSGGGFFGGQVGNLPDRGSVCIGPR